MSSNSVPANRSECSLGTLIFRYYHGDENLETQISSDDPEIKATVALDYWYTLNFCLMVKGRYPDLEALMTEDQKRSYQLLVDWWTAAYQDPAASLAFILEMEVLEYLELRRWPSGDIQDSSERVVEYDVRDCYHESLRNLFEIEFRDFGLYNDTTEQTLNLLKDYRHSAIRPAYSQQAAMWCYEVARQQMEELELPNATYEVYSDPKKTSLLGGCAEPDSSTTSFLKNGPDLEICE
ncbi:hypothetical protein GTA08_BOTSDO01700 [Botryosphaeria dothidea]|uniref:Uncharacterized protein n=1 Tax=Botryosphaeria dothidea TaxID=55169 RepID=A0A8H4NBK7_9PEZI|nr:hypothetical protein GTA08_BOTSDO01700 [Botryosphaeria dothidea]